MNCDEVRPLVGASVDRELSAGDEWRVREHLVNCADCQRAADLVREVGRGLRAAPYYRAPVALGARIVTALETAAGGGELHGSAIAGEHAVALGEAAGEEAFAVDASGAAAEKAVPAASGASTAETDAVARGGPMRDEPHATADGKRTAAADAARTTPRPPRRRAWWRDLLLRPSSGGGGASSAATRPFAAAAGWMTAALLVLAALGAAVALNLRGSAATGAFVDELVASHVRAQLSGRDLDVSSSDRHTVKPWFNGRVDYAPPVEDLSADGFPLVGGRLDYVGRERVAVLVYRYRLHVIDVYVFAPDARAASGAPAPPATSDGFALARWQRAGMTWWAITDAGPDVLSTFRAALDARLSGG